MSQPEQSIQRLMASAFAGPVFGPGDSFGAHTPETVQRVTDQVMVSAGALADRIGSTLVVALPETDSSDIPPMVNGLIKKTAAFVPALTNGELTTTQGMTGAAVAVGCMYLSDQLIDRGDEAMLLAVENYCGDQPDIPTRLVSRVQARTKLLHLMRSAVFEISSEDGPAVFECFDQKVLRAEAWLQRRSNEYLAASSPQRAELLGQHAVAIALAMSSDAGVQSVTSSLYAAYRRQNHTLTPVEDVHATPAIQAMLRVFNTTARIADEYGDWWMDAGNDPAQGVFSINPFNQYHPKLVEQLCHLADITSPVDIIDVSAAFADFHHADGANRQELGNQITSLFFSQMRQSIRQLPANVSKTHSKYIQLTKRVGEISHVNMIGDINLAD